MFFGFFKANSGFVGRTAQIPGVGIRSTDRRERIFRAVYGLCGVELELTLPMIVCVLGYAEYVIELNAPLSNGSLRRESSPN